MSDQRGFFDLGEGYQRLSEAGDPLEELGHLIDFEMFRAGLDEALDYKYGSQGSREPFDSVMMFKVLVLLQALYNLSDPQAEFQILDRAQLWPFSGAS